MSLTAPETDAAVLARRSEIADALRIARRGQRAGEEQGRSADRTRYLCRLLRYDGPAQLITITPTRSGKGVGTIIPNLLAANRSVVCIDRKGENARVTLCQREAFGPVASSTIIAGGMIDGSVPSPATTSASAKSGSTTDCRTLLRHV